MLTTSKEIRREVARLRRSGRKLDEIHARLREIWRSLAGRSATLRATLLDAAADMLPPDIRHEGGGSSPCCDTRDGARRKAPSEPISHPGSDQESPLMSYGEIDRRESAEFLEHLQLLVGRAQRAKLLEVVTAALAAQSQTGGQMVGGSLGKPAHLTGQTCPPDWASTGQVRPHVAPASESETLSGNALSLVNTKTSGPDGRTDADAPEGLPSDSPSPPAEVGKPAQPSGQPTDAVPPKPPTPRPTQSEAEILAEIHAAEAERKAATVAAKAEARAEAMLAKGRSAPPPDTGLTAIGSLLPKGVEAPKLPKAEAPEQPQLKLHQEPPAALGCGMPEASLEDQIKANFDRAERIEQLYGIGAGARKTLKAEGWDRPRVEAFVGPLHRAADERIAGPERRRLAEAAAEREAERVRAEERAANVESQTAILAECSQPIEEPQSEEPKPKLPAGVVTLEELRALPTIRDKVDAVIAAWNCLPGVIRANPMAYERDVLDALSLPGWDEACWQAFEHFPLGFLANEMEPRASMAFLFRDRKAWRIAAGEFDAPKTATPKSFLAERELRQKQARFAANRPARIA